MILDEDAHDAPLISSASGEHRATGSPTAGAVRRDGGRCARSRSVGLFAGFRALTPSDGAVPGGRRIPIRSPGARSKDWASGGSPLARWGKAELAFHPLERPTPPRSMPPNPSSRSRASRSAWSRRRGSPSRRYWMVMGIATGAPPASRGSRCVWRVDANGRRRSGAVSRPACSGRTKRSSRVDLADDSLLAPPGDHRRARRERRCCSIVETSAPGDPGLASQRRWSLRNAFVAAPRTRRTDRRSSGSRRPSPTAIEPSLDLQHRRPTASRR